MTNIFSKVKVLLYCFIIFAVILVMIVCFNSIENVLIDSLITLLPLVIIGIIGIIQWRLKKINTKNLIFICVVLISIEFFSIYWCNFISYDWREFISQWCENYQQLSVKDSLKNITVISDYVPFYNYFLILFAHSFDLIGCLYAVKFLSFVFSIIMSIVIELIICEICKTKFNYLHFVCFLILPPVLLEYTAWGQCDAIYTTFALLAFYYALKHKSVLSFISLGLAFAIKLQFLFITPIIFIMLNIRDCDGKKYLNWKWVWIVPLMYVINLVPLFVGADLKDLLLVYVKQSGSSNLFSMNCINLPFLLNPISKTCHPILINILNAIMICIGVAITITMVVLILCVAHRKTLTKNDLVRYAFCFAMIMVYFMPKMHERFYFLAMILGVIYFMIQPNTWHQILAGMVTVALTFAFLTHFIYYQIDVYHNYFYLIVTSLLFILAWLMNTTVVVCLIQPIIKNEIKAHKKLTKVDN